MSNRLTPLEIFTLKYVAGSNNTQVTVQDSDQKYLGISTVNPYFIVPDPRPVYILAPVGTTATPGVSIFDITVANGKVKFSIPAVGMWEARSGVVSDTGYIAVMLSPTNPAAVWFDVIPWTSS